MNILVLHDVFLASEGLAAMRALGTVTLMRDPSRAALLAEAAGAEAMIVGPGTFVDRQVIDAAARLKLIARIGVGVDRVDLRAATERGIFVTNNPASTADTVSEFTLALLLGLAKHIPASDRAVKEGQWVAGKERATYEIIELRGKTHGVVGMGEIGSRVAAVCRALGMKVLYFKRTRNTELERALGVEYAPFDRLIRESDTISLHTPLTAETRNLFDKPQFEAMKSTTLLINQSRGQVVNETALLEALRDGAIGGYATDVFEREPPDPESELFKLKNVIVAPHVGGLSREAGLRYSMNIAEAIRAVANGGVPENVVNRDVLGNTFR
jgi:D-3-phosphoglycerate dehydrogenase